MAEIHCPMCGAPYADGVRECAACGEPLPMTQATMLGAARGPDPSGAHMIVILAFAVSFVCLLLIIVQNVVKLFVAP